MNDRAFFIRICLFAKKAKKHILATNTLFDFKTMTQEL